MAAAIRIHKFYLYAGIIWTVLFAGMSFYWAMGGMLGVRSLGGSIYEQSLNPDPSFVALVWITGWIKLLGAVLLFMLLVNWRNRWVPSVLFYAVKISGALLFLYGFLNFVTIALSAVGILHFELDGYATLWRLVFWEPYWMIGGLFYFLSTQKKRMGG